MCDVGENLLNINSIADHSGDYKILGIMLICMGGNPYIPTTKKKIK